MADVMTPEQRSRCMSRIRGRNTKPELLLRKALWTDGFRYRIKSRLPGKPDLVFATVRVAVFIDGCFWHGCPQHGVRPKTNAKFWKRKIDRNIERDKEVNKKLRSQGWNVFRIWEHKIENDLQAVTKKLKRIIKKNRHE